MERYLQNTAKWYGASAHNQRRHWFQRYTGLDDRLDRGKYVFHERFPTRKLRRGVLAGRFHA